MDINDVQDPIIAVRISQYPEDKKQEFLILGRSNVGKSSFINSIMGRKNFAKTSSKPGKTQTLNFYLINNEFYFVDVPGYGYANVSKSVKATFGKMIEKYILNRDNLKMIFLLVDFRHKPTEDDVLMYKFLKHYNHRVTIIATKSDKVKNSERAKCKKAIIEALELDKDDKFIVTSSEKKEGLGLVLTLMDEIILESKPQIIETLEIE